MTFEQLGPYRIESVVGRGGMGTVYAAYDIESGEKAAVKVLSSSVAADENFRERFGAEIETLKRLRHPNIVQLYGYGEQDGHLFYAMELVEGCSLEDELYRGRRFDWREATHVGIDVCRALKHAHDSGVIHRDIKPANLLYSTEGKVKLSDFGIAKMFGGNRLTSDGGVLGTADYMAPEQAEGKPLTHRCDLYSLGSVLFALLAGRPPFHGNSFAEVIHQLCNAKPPRISRFADNVPEEFEQVLLQLLSKDPKKRIPTAIALGNRFEAMEKTIDELAPLRESQRLMHDEDTDVDSTAFAVGPAVEERDERETSIHESGKPIGSKNSPKADENGPSTKAYQFTTLSDEEYESQLRIEPDETDDLAWVKRVATAVVLVLLCCIVWYALQPATANQLYDRITKRVGNAEVENLLAAEDQMRDVLDKHPDHSQAAQVQVWLEAVELTRLHRRLERRARPGGRGELSLVEEAYLDAMSLENENPDEAVIKLQALVDVYGGKAGLDEDDQRCIKLCREQRDRLADVQTAKHIEDVKALNAQLDRADEMRQKQPEQATKIYRGIIELYGKKPWARKVVNRAEASASEPYQPDA